MRQVLRRHARAGVGDRDRNLTIPMRHVDRHAPARRGMAQTVIQQVAQYLGHPLRVHPHTGQAIGGLEIQRYPPVGSDGAKAGHDASHPLAHIGEHRDQCQSPGVGQAEHAQVFHQPGQQPRLLQHRLQVFGVGGEDTIGERLQVALDDGQRGAQFVGDVGGLLAAGLLSAGQVSGHLVKGGRQLPDLVARADRDADTQVARSDGPAGVGELLQRAGDGAHEQRTQHQRDHQRRPAGDRQHYPHSSQECLLFHGQPLAAGHQQRADPFAVHDNGQAGLQFFGADHLAYIGPGLVGHDAAIGAGQAQRRTTCAVSSAVPTLQHRFDALPTAACSIVIGQVSDHSLSTAHITAVGIAPELDLRGAPGQQ